VCTLQCQRTVCNALAGFFRLSYNESMPWNDITGWETTQTLGCERLITPAADTRPVYCSGWPGLACCAPQDAAAGKCGVVNSVANISLAVNQVNVSASEPGLFDALEQLHACGLVVLDLEANEMSGELSERFGRLTDLRVLNLGASREPGGGAREELPLNGPVDVIVPSCLGAGAVGRAGFVFLSPRCPALIIAPPSTPPNTHTANNWINGTIPDSLAALTKLHNLELGTNFLSGTVGDWVGDLVQLEVFSLGANSGLNAADEETGEELAGIIGTIPRGLGRLTNLVELDLQVWAGCAKGRRGGEGRVLGAAAVQTREENDSQQLSRSQGLDPPHP